MSELVRIGFMAETGQLKTAEKDLNRLTAAGGNLDSQVNRLRSTIGLLGVAMAAIGSATLTRELVQQSDAWKGINSQLRQVTKDEQDLIEQRTILLKLSKDTRSDLEATVGLYATLTRSTKELNLSQQDIAGITGTINNLFLASGKSAEEASGAIRQLSQGLAAGALRGDEFNSVAENAPRIMDALAEKLQMTRGELREFAATGGITAEVLVNALRDYSSTAQQLADQTDKTFGQAMTNANTNIIEFVGGLDSINAIVSELGEGIEYATENLDAITKAIGAGAAVISVAMLPALGKFVIAQALAAREALLLNTATIRVATGLGTYTTMAGTATVATNALGLATKIALGPIGLLLAAAGAAALVFSSYSTDTEIAAVSTADLDAEINRLAQSMEKLTNAQRDSLQLKITDRILQLEAEQRALTETIGLRSDLAGLGSEELKQTADFLGIAALNSDNLANAATHAQAKSDELASKIAELRNMLKGLVTDAEQSGASTGRLTDEMQKLIDRLDPIGAATAAYRKEQKLLSDAEKSGAITTERYLELMAELEKQFEDTKNKGKDMRTEFQRIDDTLAGLDTLMGSDLFSFGGKEQVNNIDELIDKVNQFGGAWSQVGSEIVNAFGNAASVLQDFGAQMQQNIALQNELTEARAKAGEGSAEAMRIDSALFELQQQAFQSNIGAVGKLAGVTAKAFKEQSKERKALHAIETAFAAIEIALAAEKAVMNATAAVANQGSGDPYTAFGRIAAMAGIMAGILGAAGIAFSSSSGGVDVSSIQASQGTGTLLGSEDKSESILNAMEAYNDIGIDQLAELQGIRAAMTGLTAGIAQLAVSLVTSSTFGGGNITGLGTTSSTSTGGFFESMGSNFFGKLGDPIGGINGIVGGWIDSIIGGISKTTKKLVDSGIQFSAQTLGDIFSGGFEAMYYSVIETTKRKLWGLSKKKSTSTQLEDMEQPILDEFTRIFEFIGISITEALDVLGVDAVAMLEDFAINLPKISFEGMTGEEIQKELEAVFSQQADLIAEYMLPALSQWQKMGEGAFETLTRVAREQAVFNDTLDNLGLSLGDLSNLMRVDVAQAIITMMGGLEEFTNATSEYFSKFYSEAEQLAALQGSLSDAFEQLGVTMPMTREQFRELVDSLDLTTEAGQAMFAMLMALVPGMDAYLSALEKEEKAKADAAKRLADQRQSLEIRLLEATGQSVEALALRRQLELAAADESLRALLLQIYAAEDAAAAAAKLAAEQAAQARAAEEAARAAEQAAEAFRQAVDEMIAAAEDVVNSALAAVMRAIEAERNVINAELDAARDVHKQRVDIINAERAALQEELAFRNEMLNKSQERLKAAFSNEVAMVNAAANARLDALNKERELITSNLTAARSAVTESYSAEIELIRLLSDERIAALSSERDAVSGTISMLESMTDRLKSDIGAVTVTLDKALAAARRGDFATASQYQFAAIGAESYANSVDFERDTQIQRNKAAELARLTAGQLSIEEKTLAAIESQIEKEQATADRQIAALEAQRDALLGIDKTAMSISAATAAYQAAALADSRFNYEGQKTAIEQSRDAQVSALNWQLNALLGIDNTILSVSQATREFQQAQRYLAQLNYDAQMAMLDSQESYYDAQLDSAERHAQAQLDRLQGIEDTSNAMVDAIMGVDNSVMSVELAVEALKEATLDLSAVRENADLALLYRTEADKHALAAQANMGWADPRAVANVDALIKASLAKGLSVDYLLDYFASHPDTTYQRGSAAGEYAYHSLMEMQRIAMAEEALKTAPIDSQRHSESMQKLTNLLEEMKKANEDRKAEAMAIASANRQTADILQRIELDGLDVRVEP